MASLISTGTAVPPFEVSQPEALDFLLRHFPLKPATRALYERVFRHPSVATRRFAVERLEDLLNEDLDRVNARFQKAAVSLATEALKKALAAAGILPTEVDFLAATTCTGYLCPGLAAHAAETAGLRPDVRYLDLAGMGCGAALPALEAARNFLAAHPDGTAAVVSAEVCSATLFSDDDAGLVVSNALFADGAAAAVMKAKGAGPRIVDFTSLLVPAWRDTLRFKSDGGRLRNVLGPQVPAQSAEAMEKLADRLLGARGIKRSDVAHWILHPGGSKVLDAIEKRLGLPSEVSLHARGVLRRFGNMSSPSCLFVLEETLRSLRPSPGETGILAAFGAGFSAHAALLEF